MYEKSTSSISNCPSSKLIEYLSLKLKKYKKYKKLFIKLQKKK